LAFAARGLIRGADRAALGTMLAGVAGPCPYVSLVTVATDTSGRPLLLLSQLSDHTRNIGRDPSVSLLFDGTQGYANPQQGPRVTLVGRVVRSDDPRDRRRFLARHPRASLYAGFGDFAVFRVDAERAHWVGGFGQAAWLDPPLTCPAGVVDDFLAGEDRILAEINDDPSAALDPIAHRLLKRRGAGWRLVGLDPDGCDLAHGKTVARLAFGSLQGSIEQARRSLAELAQQARNIA
jgi:putative heme iron utilization protein